MCETKHFSTFSNKMIKRLSTLFYLKNQGQVLRGDQTR